MLNECTTYVLKGLHALAQQLLGCLRTMMQSISSQLQRQWLEENVNDDWIHYVAAKYRDISPVFELQLNSISLLG